VVQELKRAGWTLIWAVAAAFDVFIAGRKVGVTGMAISVDMTPDMVAKARRNTASNRQQTGLDNVEFRLSEIEHLPLA